MSLFNFIVSIKHFLTTAKNTKDTVLTVLSGKESSMARKVPSLWSVLMMITALIVTVPAQADLQLFYVHNDHLGTPKYLTDTTGKAVWQAQATPFGEVTEKEDLDGDGKYVTLNMRFPGQYWDHEMGTSYNFYRDYDPSLGRYIQSDPIGLVGGINTYGYVEGNPLSFEDPKGLLKMHGAWCGPDWTGGFKKSWDKLDSAEKSVTLPPVDELDTCCMVHDITYAQCREEFPCDEKARAKCFKRADRALSMCADSTPDTTTVSALLFGHPKTRVRNYMESSLPDSDENPPQCDCNK